MNSRPCNFDAGFYQTADMRGINMKFLHLAPVVLFLGLNVGMNAQAQMLVKLCYEDANYFPWQIKGAHGLDNNLLEMASARSGVKIEMLALPWKRCLSDVGYGTQAGVFAASYNADRAAYAAYPMIDDKLDASRRIRFDSYSLYRLKGNPVSWDGKQLTNLKKPVGVQLGYSASADLIKLGAAVDESSVVVELQMRKLVVGRVDLVALLTFEGDALLEKAEFSDKVEKLSPPLIEKPYFLIFNKDYYRNNKKLADDLWAAVASARESVEFKALRQAAMKKGPPAPSE